MTLLELADACERAKGADGLLDVAISNACGIRSHGDGYGAPPFTASLDAGMQFVPEGRHTEMAMQDRHSLRWKWTLRGGYGVRSEARANTAPLAICAAALRARHAMESE